MRWLALGLVVGTLGCDAIFGIHDTKLDDPDSSIGPDARWLEMQITGEVLTKATGAGIIDHPAIPGLTVQAGPVGGTLSDVAVGDQGNFLLPPELAEKPYRIVYTAPGDVPVELQSMLHAAHLVVTPLWGRLPRTPPPTGSGINFQPSGISGTIANARVMTLERWTLTPVGNVAAAGFAFPYAANAVSLSGDKATLEGAQDDREILLGYTVDAQNGVTFANGYMTAKIGALAAGSFAQATGPWNVSTTATLASSWGDEFQAGGRLTSALGTLSPLIQPGPLVAGAIPSTSMPAFTWSNPGASPAGPLPPVLLPLYESTGSMSPHTFSNPFNGTDAPALQLVLMRSYLAKHTVSGGPTLTSALEVVVPAQDGNPNPTDIRFAVGLARNVSLGGTPLTSDGTTVTRAAQLGLSFDTDQPVDYCEATFERVSGMTVTPLRRFIVLKSALGSTQVDSTLFEAGMTYVARIDCYDGYDETALAAGDFSAVAYPSKGFSMSTVFTGTFKVN